MDNPVLFSQILKKLNITWSDTETNARVEEIIDGAIPDLIHRLGITDENFDFSVPGAENTLFKNYCLYEWNHSLNEFFDNYAESIAQIRTKNEVAQFLESEEDNAETEIQPI
jgi:hypothetical protein